MATKKQNAKPMTTAQQLGSIVKSAGQIMRKDKGLNGDLDRLPMLTWIMLLKFFDDLRADGWDELMKFTITGLEHRLAVVP